MKKPFVPVILIMLGTINAIHAQDRVSLDSALAETVDYLNERLPAGSKVVVLNFRAENPALSDYVIDEIITNIVNTRVLTVADRQHLDIIRQEMNFQMSGEVSDESAQAIGKKLGAQTIVSGEILPFGRAYRLRVRAISVETAVIQGTVSRNIAVDGTVRTLTADSSSSGNSGFSLSAGGGLLLGLSFMSVEGNGWGLNFPLGGVNFPAAGESEFDIGAFAFLDAKFVEISMALYYGAAKGEYMTVHFSGGNYTGYEATAFERSRGYFEIGVLGKFPFALNHVLLYPLWGIQYQVLLSSGTDGEKAAGDLSKNNALWIKPGAGIDYAISRSLFIRGELLWGFKIPSQNESNKGTRNDVGLEWSYFTHGPSVKVGLGYRF